jgi:hypothetical protein
MGQKGNLGKTIRSEFKTHPNVFAPNESHGKQQSPKSWPPPYIFVFVEDNCHHSATDDCGGVTL